MNGKLRQGFSVVEVLVMIILVVLIAAVFLRPTYHGGKAKPSRIKCVNNLKNVGLAFRIFATDNEDRFPPSVLISNGMDVATIDALTVFRYLSNELSTPKILHCPSDDRRQKAELNSFSGITLKNISYFASLTASEQSPLSILAGDRNLQTNGVPVQPGLLVVTTNIEIAWTKELHIEQGNIVMGDGSVYQLSTSTLKSSIRDQELATNYLAIP